MKEVRIIGPGRAGSSLAGALDRMGWRVAGVLGRSDDARAAAHGVDALVIATADGDVAHVAGLVEPDPATAVLHLSGSLGLEALDPHPRRASLHPLVPLPDAATGAERLSAGAVFAVDGDPIATEIATALGGRCIRVPRASRAAYHAAACVASNHVVALLAQAALLADEAGIGIGDLVGLTAASLADVARLGPRRALTGPAARGDTATLERHRAVLDRVDAHAQAAGAPAGIQRRAYDACAQLAAALAGTGASPGDAGADRDRPRGDAQMRSREVPACN